MVGGAVFVGVDAVAGCVFVDEAVVRGAVGGGAEDVRAVMGREGDGEETGDDGLLQPLGKGRREEGVGRCEWGGVGLEAAVGEVAPGGEGHAVDLWVFSLCVLFISMMGKGEG